MKKKLINHNQLTKPTIQIIESIGLNYYFILVYNKNTKTDLQLI